MIQHRLYVDRVQKVGLSSDGWFVLALQSWLQKLVNDDLTPGAFVGDTTEEKDRLGTERVFNILSRAKLSTFTVSTSAVAKSGCSPAPNGQIVSCGAEINFA